MGRHGETLSVTEVAALCGVTRRTVNRWLNGGGLIGMRYGKRGQWRITKEALDLFRQVGGVKSDSGSNHE